ncbi:MAG: AEC family transporter [Rhodobacteraceae bacterium]|nr:AEC family transporter [Paracoccaceae bacterium]
MSILLEITVPVFLLIGAGYLAVWSKRLTDNHISGLMKFAQGIAIPCLLFKAMAGLDMQQNVGLFFVTAFYAGSVVNFAAGLFGTRYIFHRAWEDSVVIGFTALFGNTVLLGLAIVGRAYGGAALEGTFALVALHAPFCYLLGITTMELLRADSDGVVATARTVLTSIFSNAIMLGIFAGLAFNLLGLRIPTLIDDALSMIAASALPAALFGLGGVLVRYKPEGDIRLIAFVCALSLGLHPMVTWLLGHHAFSLQIEYVRSSVITAAMAPGINAYIFSDMYKRAQRVTASSVLGATALSILTASGWIFWVG